jgi:hypothetical protein
MFPIKTVQDYMYPQKLKGELEEQRERARLYGQQAQWHGPKAQSEIDLINQGQIPHYLALNDLIHSGQIPHYLAQNRLIDMGQVPHFQAQNRLLGEQAQDVGYGNKLKGAQWKEWKRLQDEMDELNGVTGQQAQPSQMSQDIPESYFTPEMKRQIEESNRIVDLRNAGKDVRQNLNEPTLNSALNVIQGQPGVSPPQQNNSFVPAPQRIDEAMGQLNQPTQAPQQQQEMPQYLGDANQQLQAAAQQPFNKEQRIAELRAQQQAIFGNFGKSGKAATETPEEKRRGQVSVAQEKENIKEAAKDAEKAELASESSQVAEGALNKMLESSKRITALQSGWLGGHSPGVSDARQEFDQASAVLQKSVMDSMKGQGQMSQAKMAFIESLKPNSKMNEKVREKVAHTLLSVAKRSGERITFNAAATDAGFDPKQTKVLWKLYNNERPEYDSKNQRPIDENLNTFSDYINHDALDAAMHGKPYSPKKQEEESNMVMIQLPTGQKGNISKEKLDEALKRGARVIQ